MVPIKCDNSLKVSGAITDVKLMVKCCAKKRTRKSPDKAIANFFATEDFINPPIGFEYLFKNFTQKYASKYLLTNFQNRFCLFRISISYYDFVFVKSIA
ncbi:hypothetical protein GCM10008088_01810 [Mesonia mobilis]|uniref:Uncharacterized protein n=1 Tax=Mesonia mobilis TaxID=369791 RepID=A0ABQ3BHN9_9FLAO|nr:hypothetical protein GCM10008088_01810 [Mesonia mobilis]